MLSRNELRGDNGIVAIDNWFNSVSLARYIFEKGNYTLGMVRPCRGVPKPLKDFKMDPPSVEFSRNENIIIAKFTDKRGRCECLINKISCRDWTSKALHERAISKRIHPQTKINRWLQFRNEWNRSRRRYAASSFHRPEDIRVASKARSIPYSKDGCSEWIHPVERAPPESNEEQNICQVQLGCCSNTPLSQNLHVLFDLRSRVGLITIRRKYQQHRLADQDLQSDVLNAR